MAENVFCCLMKITTGVTGCKFNGGEVFWNLFLLRFSSFERNLKIICEFKIFHEIFELQ
jgi:hypothetical protein